jgi:hypothetical protein
MDIKELLIRGWFVSLKLGQVQLNVCIVKVFCKGCDVRHITHRLAPMKVFGWLPSSSVLFTITGDTKSATSTIHDVFREKMCFRVVSLGRNPNLTRI